jgi:hypothetical protein
MWSTGGDVRFRCRAALCPQAQQAAKKRWERLERKPCQRVSLGSAANFGSMDWLSLLFPYDVNSAYVFVFAASSLIYIALRLRAYVIRSTAPPPPPPPPLTFTYHDSFLGKAVCIPVVHHLQSATPLMLLTPALHFARGRAAAGAAFQQPAPPVGCMLVEVWPAQHTRFMFGFTLKACDRASTAPASSHVYFRTASRWSAGILQRVMAGYASKEQAQWLLRAGERRLFL